MGLACAILTINFPFARAGLSGFCAHPPPLQCLFTGSPIHPPPAPWSGSSSPNWSLCICSPLPFHLQMWTLIFLMTLSCPCFNSWRGSVLHSSPATPALPFPRDTQSPSEPAACSKLYPQRAASLRPCFPLPFQDQGQGSFHPTLTLVPSSFGHHSTL